MSIQQQASIDEIWNELRAQANRMEELSKVKPETVQALFSEYTSRVSILYRRVDELDRILRAISNKFDKLLDRVKD